MTLLRSIIKFLPLAALLFQTMLQANNESDIYPSKQPPLALEDYFTQTWTTHDGLPHNGINALAQTEDGYLWVGTWEGLVRFNGRKFTLFTRGSKVGLPDSAIKSLSATSTGELLVAGARGGVSERKSGVWFPQKPAATMVLHAVYDNTQGIWLALEGKGLVFRDTKTKKDTTIIPNLRVYKLLQDENNILWAATSKGLYSVENNTKIQHFNEDNGLPNNSSYSLLLSKSKQLIVGTEHGAYSLKGNHFTLIHQQLASKAITSMLQDKNNDIWFGTSGYGLFRLSDNGLERLDDNKGLPNNHISSLYEDKENSIWVGTSSGLFRLREAPFITLTEQQGLAGNYVRSVLSHSDGSLWVGSSKGLNKIVNRKISTIPSPELHIPLSVLSLAETNSNQVLVGTYSHGVYKVVDGKLVLFMDNKTGLPNNQIRSILTDSKNNIWIGTASGLVKVSAKGKLSHFNKETGLPANFIMALAEDEQGQVWIGSGLGVTSYKDGALQTYKLSQQFDAEYAFGFFTEKEFIWMATDRGLIRINLTNNKMHAITRDNGLPVDKLFQVVADNHNNFWLTSNRGVIKVSRSEINQVFNKQTNIVNYELFAEGVGLLSSQANGGSTPAATIHKDGSIWIATAKGVSQVTETRLNQMAEKTLPVVIEEFIVDGKHYLLSGYALNNSKANTQTLDKSSVYDITLNANASRIVIHYAGLGFLMSKHIQYQTQLIGFDEHWVNKSNQTYSEFTNLPPGHYTFNMRAKYPNGTWKNNIATLSFDIPAQFWQTGLFKLLIIITVLIALYLLYRYRVLAIERNQKTLKKLVTKQTQDLKQQAELFAFQATHDQLTGLSNRRAFDSWCDVDFKQSKHNNKLLSLAILDIDHFKRVNDGYSHIVGDKVIKMLADQLLTLTKQCPYPIKLARWGGEEFTMLIFASQDEAFKHCELIRKTIEKYDFYSVAPELNITISIGLTDNQAVNEYDKMISHADQALYYAKHHGRNQVRIYQKEDIIIPTERT